MADFSLVFHYGNGHFDMTLVIAVQLRNTNRNIPLCLQDKASMVGQEGMMMSSFVLAIDNSI
jgi:hypothetical protein